MLETLHVTPEHLQETGWSGRCTESQNCLIGGSEAESQASAVRMESCIKILSASQRAALNDFPSGWKSRRKFEDFLLTQIRRRRYGVASGIILSSHPKMYGAVETIVPEDSCGGADPKAVL